MTLEQLYYIKTWVFDLDNTLYPPSIRLFDQIEIKMQKFVASFLNIRPAEADVLRKKYWQSHGTTLAGMMEMHSMPPEDFLEKVHDIDFSVLSKSSTLAGLIAALPGRKIVYTNGTEPYARQVLKARGLENEFEAVYGIEHANYRPKPLQEAFQKVFELARITPSQSAMFEDECRNLKVPSQLGMKTIFISPEQKVPNFVDITHPNLEIFLSKVVEVCFPERLNALHQIP